MKTFRHEIACENIRFSLLFAAGDVAKSEEKRMFLQAKHEKALLVRSYLNCYTIGLWNILLS